MPQTLFTHVASTHALPVAGQSAMVVHGIPPDPPDPPMPPPPPPPAPPTPPEPPDPADPPAPPAPAVPPAPADPPAPAIPPAPAVPLEELPVVLLLLLDESFPPDPPSPLGIWLRSIPATSSHPAPPSRIDAAIRLALEKFRIRIPRFAPSLHEVLRCGYWFFGVTTVLRDVAVV